MLPLEKRVLLIEHDEGYAKQITLYLRKQGIFPIISGTIRNAAIQMMTHAFDVVALDMNVEDAARLVALLLDLRHAKNTLLLLFPIKDADARASFLICGIDMCLSDNVAKECAAAICALLRRPSAREYPAEDAPSGRIIYRELTIDPLRQKVLMAGREVTLTSLEFKLLYFLASNPSIVFSRDLLYERVWRESSLYGSKSVCDLICSIRRKLDLPANDSQYIKTIRGAGYCFAP